MELDVNDNPECVASTFALSSEQVLPLGPVYHLTVYGEVPPDHVELKVTDCPESIVGLDGEIVGVERAGDTVTSEFMLLVVAAPILTIIILLLPAFSI